MRSEKFPPTLSDTIASARYERMMDIIRRLKQVVEADRKFLPTAFASLQSILGEPILAALVTARMKRITVYNMRSEKLLARARRLRRLRLVR